MTYGKMAYVYDVLMEDAPYDDWQRFTETMFSRYHSNVKTVADLGCGTGQITRRLAKQGYELLGVDYSSEMLTYAERAATDEQLSIQWIQQDLRTLEGFQNLDAVVSFCDVINYVTEEQEVKQVFQCAHNMLNDNGLFLFDVHAVSYIEHTLKGSTFAEIYDDLTYIWLCQPGEGQGEVFHELTFFVQNDELYERFDETHHQRTYHVADYEQWLINAGFKIQGIYADFDTENISADGERLFFVCQKQQASL